MTKNSFPDSTVIYLCTKLVRFVNEKRLGAGGVGEVTRVIDETVVFASFTIFTD